MYAWISLLRRQTPLQQIRILSIVGVATLALTMIPLAFWKSLLPTPEGPGALISAVVTHETLELEVDASLVSFAVKFTAPGEQAPQWQVVYTLRDDYLAAGVKPGSTLLLTLDDVEDAWQIRIAQTPSGYVLFDEWVDAYSVSVHNVETLKYIIVLSAFAFVCFVACIIIWYRRIYRGRQSI